MSPPVRRHSSHEDYLQEQVRACHLEDSDKEIVEEESTQAVLESSGLFHGHNDSKLHCLPKAIYSREVARKVTSIYIDKCPIKWLGTKERCEDDIREYTFYSIEPLSFLKELIVMHGELTELPIGLGSLIHLKVINIAGNAITSLPEDIAQSPSLEVLDVSSNLLKEKLPEEILQSRSLKVLRLQDNDLESKDFPYPEEWVNCPLKLQELKIDESIVKARNGLSPYPLTEQGQLVAFPEKERQSILVRQAKDSSLAFIPPKGERGQVKFNPQVQVRTRIENSDDKDGHDQFEDFPLELTIKTLDDFVEQIEKTQQAKQLGLKGPLAKVSQIYIEGEEGINGCLYFIKYAEAVRAISLIKCGITTLPENFFEGLHSLKYVDLRDNKLSYIPLSFSKNVMIRSACFDNNFITSFPYLPVNLIHLRMNNNCLCVSNNVERCSNPISKKHFERNRGLKRLEIKNNTILPVDFFPDKEAVTHLELQIFLCDRKAVLSTNREHWPLFMESGYEPQFFEVADDDWLEKMKGSTLYTRYGKTLIGKSRFAKRAFIS